VQTQLRRTKLTSQLFDALVAHIIGERLQPGDPLPSTAALCEQYGASRSVVREALSALEAVGLVEVHSGRNAVVRELDGHLIQLFLTRAMQLEDRSLAALMEVRAPLEIQAARLAAERADPQTLDRIDGLLHQMDDALADTHAYPVLDVAFHMEIARATGNPALVWFTESLREQLMEVMVEVRCYREEHGLVGNEQNDHAKIAAAIRARDPAGAEHAMREHMTTSVGLVDSVELDPGHTGKTSTTMGGG
jgi:GntR family transcriptional repressor for pyruvate dehydrogenase complex